MKPCDDRWREELIEHVLGSPLSAALKEHLETCAVCFATLREWKTRTEQIEAGILHMAASEPAAHAVPRIMAQVRARRPGLWLPEWRWRMALLSGLVIAASCFSYEWRASELRLDAQKVVSAGSAIANWSSPTASLLRFSADGRLNAPTQFGKYFYQLNANAPEKE